MLPTDNESKHQWEHEKCLGIKKSVWELMCDHHSCSFKSNIMPETIFFHLFLCIWVSDPKKDIPAFSSIREIRRALQDWRHCIDAKLTGSGKQIQFSLRISLLFELATHLLSNVWQVGFATLILQKKSGGKATKFSNSVQDYRAAYFHILQFLWKLNSIFMATSQTHQVKEILNFSLESNFTCSK